MGRRGRLPDPNSASSKAALVRAAALGATQASANAEPVSMPKSLAKRPAAKRYWTQHADDLVAAGRLRQPQAETFALLCSMYADIEDLGQQVATDGWTTSTAIAPAARLLLNCRRDFVALAKEFGLTAASSMRIPAAVEATSGETDEETALRNFCP